MAGSSGVIAHSLTSGGVRKSFFGGPSFGIAVSLGDGHQRQAPEAKKAAKKHRRTPKKAAEVLPVLCLGGNSDRDRGLPWHGPFFGVRRCFFAAFLAVSLTA